MEFFAPCSETLFLLCHPTLSCCIDLNSYVKLQYIGERVVHLCAGIMLLGHASCKIAQMPLSTKLRMMIIAPPEIPLYPGAGFNFSSQMSATQSRLLQYSA